MGQEVGSTRCVHEPYFLRQAERLPAVTVGPTFYPRPSSPLSEVRLSSGHPRRAQFGPGYDFFTSPALLAEALRQGPVSDDLRVAYTGAWVKGYGTERAEVWATSQPDPYDEATAFVRVSDAPAFFAPSAEVSSAALVAAVPPAAPVATPA